MEPRFRTYCDVQIDHYAPCVFVVRVDGSNPSVEISDNVAVNYAFPRIP